MNTAKVWLSRAWRVEREVKALEQEKQTALERVTGGGTADVVVSGTKDPHAALDAYVVYSEKLDARIADLLAVQGEISDVISRIQDERYRELLQRRYIGGDRWDAVAAAMGYEVRSVYRMHGAALQVVQTILSERCH